MSQLVTIFGGSGFVGRHIAWAMAQRGWRVRVAVRRPAEAGFVRPFGVVGQVEPVFCNIRDDESVREVTRRADAVVNCVGILAESGANRFGPVQARGAGRIARTAAEEGVGRLVQISAIGADPDAASHYARTKGEGERAVREHFPAAVILRPSIIFGPGDGFFNRFAAMARTFLVVPLVGGRTRFQPVYVEDLADAAALGVEGRAAPGLYELGGPEVATFRALMERMLAVIHRRRLLMPVPFWAAGLMGRGLDAMQGLSLGLFSNTVLTADQVRNLRRDNVADAAAKGFAELGIVPTTLDAVLPEYLWRFRPSGQYDAINRSARNLR